MKTKPVVVFVPGLGATGRTYKPFLERLGKTYDVRVAMHSLELPETPTEDFFFAAIDAAAPAAPFRLVGHSMGGSIALMYAARYPRRVQKVVAMAPALFPYHGQPFKGLNRFRMLRRSRSFLAAALGHPLHGLEALRERDLVLSDGRATKLYSWVNKLDLSDSLPMLGKAVILWARHEEVLTPHHWERLVDEFPAIRTRLVPGSHNHLALAPRRLVPIVKQELR